ncbi:hypothetical protein JT358_15020 [Micrococcales bacterium 31B]|nr:hypothetical protein [Micrococcales bacterium 31B]
MKSKTSIILIGAMCCALTLALPACSEGEQVKSLGSAEIALYASPQYMDMTAMSSITNANPGRIYLIESNGSYRTIPTKGMDRAQVAWGRNGLYFSDIKNDYLLTDSSLETYQNEKANIQVAAIEFESDKFMGVFNEGMDSGVYEDQLVTAASNSAAMGSVQGNLTAVATCGSSTMGIGQATAPFSVNSPAGETAAMLVRISPLPTPHTEFVAASAEFDWQLSERLIPCQRDEVIFIANTTGSGSSGAPQPSIIGWNTITGKFAAADLSLPSTAPAVMTDQPQQWPRYSGDSLRGGFLEWVGAGNSVWSTNIMTGETRKKYEIAIGTRPQDSYDILFTEKTLEVLVENYETSDIAFISYDRETGHETRRVDLKDFKADLPDGAVIRGFAVRPHNADE